MAITNKYKRIPLEQIEVLRDERQRRTIKVDDLLPGIRLRGVVSPIIVEELTDGKFLLVAGERRYTASRELGLKDIPARLVTDLTKPERQILELEENIKRKDLDWKDEARAHRHIHKLYLERDPSWTLTRTAEAIGIHNGQLSMLIRVAEELDLDNKAVHSCSGWRPAYNIIMRKEGRAIDDAMNDLLSGHEEPEPPLPEPDIGPVGTPQEQALRTAMLQSPARIAGTPEPRPAPRTKADVESILTKDFNTWAQTYNDRPFSFIHCDFPYGIDLHKSGQANTAQWGGYDDEADVYWKLCHTLALHLDRIMTQSGHLLFWLSCDIERQYETIKFFRAHAPSLEFRTVPIYWHKTDNKGILPDPKRGPRQVVETALVASRGDRLIIRAVSNAYGAPTAKDLHQSEKPEPMLRHFFQMFIDEHSRVLDPTCGSGSALRAAESLGAAHVLGLEVNSEFADIARIALRKSRNLRSLEKRS